MYTPSPARLCAALAFFLVASPGTARGSEPDLSTPRRALRVFIDSARAGEFARSAHALDLRDLPPEERLEAGPRLARELKAVLDATLWVEWDRISDAPEGDSADGDGADVIGTVPLGTAEVPIRLVRSPEGSWRIGPGVVAATPRLSRQHGPGWIANHVPQALRDVRLLELEAWQWIGLGLALLLAAFAAGAVGAGARRVALRLARRTSVEWDERLVETAAAPGRLLLALATFGLTARSLRLAIPAQATIDHALRIASVVLACWVGLRALRFAADTLDARFGRDGERSSRSRQTQLMVLRRIAGFLIVLVGAALVLVQFEQLRALGTSVLASAGVAGLVVGLAAQRSIATLLAGVQISLTQPLRVGDVVVIEGEWGTIEEITLTFVVVRIWDLRRLIVPITKILDAPFQNWTRSSGDILGTVFVHADYRLPVEAVRAELTRFVATRPEWDGKVVGLQVTAAGDRTLELRALVSSSDASRNWDLRCAVREHLVTFLQRLDGGTFLPRTRIDVPALPAARNLVSHRPREQSGR